MQPRRLRQFALCAGLPILAAVLLGCPFKGTVPVDSHAPPFPIQGKYKTRDGFSATFYPWKDDGQMVLLHGEDNAKGFLVARLSFFSIDDVPFVNIREVADEGKVHPIGYYYARLERDSPGFCLRLVEKGPRGTVAAPALKEFFRKHKGDADFFGSTSFCFARVE